MLRRLCPKNTKIRQYPPGLSPPTTNSNKRCPPSNEHASKRRRLGRMGDLILHQQDKCSQWRNAVEILGLPSSSSALIINRWPTIPPCSSKQTKNLHIGFKPAPPGRRWLDSASAHPDLDRAILHRRPRRRRRDRRRMGRDGRRSLL